MSTISHVADSDSFFHRLEVKLVEYIHPNYFERLPTNPGTTPTDSLCADQTGLVPIVTRTAPSASFTPTVDDLEVNFDVTTSKVAWTVNSSSIQVAWDKPTLEYVLEGNTSYPTNLNLIQLPSSNVVSLTA